MKIFVPFTVSCLDQYARVSFGNRVSFFSGRFAFEKDVCYGGETVKRSDTVKNNALELFSAVPRNHNCAQAVACGCGHCELKETLSSCGGGRAEEGRCGALHAALMLVNDEADKEAVRHSFVAENSSEFCRELKAAGVPCTKCVESAAALAEKFGGVKE